MGLPVYGAGLGLPVDVAGQGLAVVLQVGFWQKGLCEGWQLGAWGVIGVM